MTELASLLCAVIDNADDDSVRLVFADALEEAGQGERAEFIRVQLTLAAIGEPVCERPHGQASPCRRFFLASERPWCRSCVDTERLEPLRRRERALLGSLRPQLTVALPSTRPECHSWGLYLLRHDDGMDDEYTLGFSRGFAERCTVPLAGWFKHGPALTRQHPIETVRIADREAGWWATNSRTPGNLDRTQCVAWMSTRTPSPGQLNDFHRDLLPWSIFERLPPPYADEAEEGETAMAVRAYAGAVAANMALSTAALAWAREAPP